MKIVYQFQVFVFVSLYDFNNFGAFSSAFIEVFLRYHRIYFGSNKCFYLYYSNIQVFV